MIAVNDMIIEQGHFPDGTLLMKFNPELAWRKPCRIEWRYESDSELFTLICLKRHLDQANINPILCLFYVPHARQDRVKNPEDVFTLKYFCEVINSLNFPKVEILDVHSNITPALLNNCYPITVDSLFVGDVIDTSGANFLFYPDEGAMKRYSASCKCPYAFGVKRRNWETGKIESLDIIGDQEIEGKRVLIIDDICSRGGTFVAAAKKLREMGAASVSLWVTHLEPTVFEGELLTSDLIDTVYSTNSLISFEAAAANKKIKLVNVWDAFDKGVRK